MEKNAQKRSASERGNILDGVKAVLVDFDGTSSPSSFMKDSLIPYARDHVKSYLEKHFACKELQSAVDTIRQQAAADFAGGVDGAVVVPAVDSNQSDIIDAVIANVMWLMNSGRKTTGLRQFQIQIWRAAFKSNALQGDVYDDVASSLKKLAVLGIKAYSFSSASVETQKLVVGHSNYGDLTDKFSGYFDTTSGSKVEKDAYTKIAAEVELSPEEILYITHLPTEATAAHAAGLKTCLVTRSDSPELTDDDLAAFTNIFSLSELFNDDDVVPAKKVCAGGEETSSDGSDVKGGSDDSRDGEVAGGGDEST